MKKSKIESGRSMVEMLGVLAIIGVLSVGGIAGYKAAMEKITTNHAMEILNDALVEMISDDNVFEQFRGSDGEFDIWSDNKSKVAQTKAFSSLYGLACQGKTDWHVCPLQRGSGEYTVSVSERGSGADVLWVNFLVSENVCRTLVQTVLSNREWGHYFRALTASDVYYSYDLLDETKLNAFLANPKNTYKGNVICDLEFYYDGAESDINYTSTLPGHGW